MDVVFVFLVEEMYFKGYLIYVMEEFVVKLLEGVM